MACVGISAATISKTAISYNFCNTEPCVYMMRNGVTTLSTDYDSHYISIHFIFV